jgi:hypothetical protein
MRVFRMENMNGTGPFGHAPTTRPMMNAVPMHHSMLPTPRNEGLKLAYGCNFCGCKSIQELRETWFPPPCQPILETNGFNIVEYEVPDYHVQQGSYQLLFEKSQAQVIALHPVRG